MEQKLKLKKSVLGLLMNGFNTDETLSILRSNLPVYWSWGVERVFSVEDKGLVMKVNGHHHKGWVLITLGGDDYYRVHILTKDGEILDSFSEVCFDELVQIIDDRIERIEEYEF